MAAKNNPHRYYLGKLRYVVLAQDEPVEEPSEEEMVTEFKVSPVANWKEYLQLIIRKLQVMYHVPVALVGPQVEAPYGSLDAGFNIRGFLNFPQEKPLILLEKFGDNPIVFRAYIANGNLVDPIELSLE